MGIFDTVRFDPPRACVNCGTAITEVQTKVFEPGLREYHVGDLIQGSPILSGVIREELYCPGCAGSDHRKPQFVWFSLWHTLLVGVYDTPREAEARLQEVDRAELLDYLARHQQAALTWHDRFSRLYGELQNYQDYLRASPQEQQDRENMRFFRIREILATDDPLAALISSNKPQNPEDETEVGDEG
ncbi:hypothetical protein AU468_01210 [Alkalispirochaeta sphaeroplastigenens]|uniref:CpXC domain-containing protein n=1 Tax=Alkalispirochaeta sphaeroplastigenens TaxID=1187066 RepID=A0A2S4K0P8_9SPIO|nr:hypothetical protein [Alkalispirochaeta sphaeroplastigenens]POR05328.1 hypothetical protein AU468_01210 [Alkalispirochaeta sphaeroplastigenens]